MSVVTIKSSQKLFTEDEVSGLTGICLETHDAATVTTVKL